MASTSRLTTPPRSPARDRVPAEPVTPDANLRNDRHSRSPMNAFVDLPHQEGDASPSSRTASSGSGVGRDLARALDSRSSLRYMHSSWSSLNSINIATPTRKVIVRADPSIITTFDPADKELYDLWAPKK